MIDAPVSGGQAGAENAALSIMIGGAKEDVDAARPLLDVVGKTVVHVGPAGAGQTVKAANQLIVAGNIALVAEAITFLEAHGADLPAAVEVLGGGLAGSAVLNQKAPKMLDRRFRARLPDRPAPQGHGHRDRGRPRSRGRHPGGRARGPAGGRDPRRGRRRAGPLRHCSGPSHA